MLNRNAKAPGNGGNLLARTLTPERVVVLEDKTKDAALRRLIGILAESPGVQDEETLATAVFKREALMSTGIGLGLAVPHVRLPSVKTLTMAVGIAPEGIDDYAALDDKPVHLIFLIAAPEGQHTEYLQLLAAISSRAKSKGDQLRAATEPESFYNVLLEA